MKPRYPTLAYFARDILDASQVVYDHDGDHEFIQQWEGPMTTWRLLEELRSTMIVVGIVGHVLSSAPVGR